MRIFKRFLLFFLIVFLIPAGASAGYWYFLDRPSSWREADWTSSGMLPAATASPDAVVYVMAARTGGMKGALSVHSWIVTKKAGDAAYQRYDKVGWGSPVRVNAYAADANWYSNRPYVVAEARGAAAESLIPQIEAAVASYPFARPGDYSIWPGPNSNSFIAHVLRNVPDLEAELPPTAVGRDYVPGFFNFDIDSDIREIRLSLGGFAGMKIGLRSGFELQLFGLVAGLDFLHPALKIPGIGRVALWPPGGASEESAPAA